MAGEFSVIGVEKTLAAFKKLAVDVESEATKAVAETTVKIHSDVLQDMAVGTKSGITYHRGKGRNLSPTHRASAAGEAPAVDTGDYIRSIKMKTRGLSGEVFSEMRRSFWLEFGTMKTAPRPHFFPALRANEGFFKARLQVGLDNAAKGFSKK